MNDKEEFFKLLPTKEVTENGEKQTEILLVRDSTSHPYGYWETISGKITSDTTVVDTLKQRLNLEVTPDNLKEKATHETPDTVTHILELQVSPNAIVQYNGDLGFSYEWKNIHSPEAYRALKITAHHPYYVPSI